MDATPRDHSQTERTIAPLFTWRSAIAESDLAPTTRHVLLALSLYMNERGGSAYPGSARLARDTGLHQATVKGHLQTAVQTGWIEVIRQGGSNLGGRRLASEYVARTPVDNGPDDRARRTTGGSVRDDRGSSTRRPGAQDAPITSLNTPMNSRDDSPLFDSGPVPPPWVERQMTYAEWTDLQRQEDTA